MGVMNEILAFTLAAMILISGCVPFVMNCTGDEQSDANSQEALIDVTSSEAISQELGFDIWQSIRNSVGDFFIGIGMGYVALGLTIKDSTSTTTTHDAGDDTEVKKAMRQMAMQYAAKSTYDISNVSYKLIDNNNRTWVIGETYLDRAAEISASSLWEKGTVYNSNNVLIFSGIYDLMGDSLFNTKDAADYAIRNSADYVQTWEGVNWGEGNQAKVSILWDGYQSDYARSSIRLVFDTIVKATSPQQSDNTIYLVNSAGQTNGGIYCLQSGTISSIDGSVSKQLNMGCNDVSSLPSGMYTISAGTYAGMFLPVCNTDSVTVRGGAVVVRDSEIGFLTVKDDVITAEMNGYSVEAKNIGFRFSDDSNTYSTTTIASSNTSSLDNMIKAYAGQIDTFSSLLYKADNAGYVMWKIMSNAGDKCVLLSPSSVSPNLVSLGIDADQSYALYASALEQISTYYQTYGEYISSSDVRISSESLKLYCYGTIYSESGEIIEENVIFTPYVTLNSTSISDTTLSSSNIMTEDATAMIWKRTNSSSYNISDFDSSDPESHGVCILPKGSSFEITSMIYDGELVHSTTLTVKTIGKIPILQDAEFVLEDSPKVLDADILMMIVIVEFGIIIALIGVTIRQPIVIIIGVVICLIGIFATDWITGIITDIFGK